MSGRTRKGSYWRTLRCEGCYLRCSYKAFRIMGPDAFAERVAALHVDSQNPKDWTYRRRGTVLGQMHADKLDAWNALVNSCPNWGAEERPEFTVDEAVEWDYRGHHHGTVLEVVPAGVDGRARVRSYRGAYQFGPSYYSQMEPVTRERLSYLVLERRGTLKIVCWPIASLLRRK